MTQGHISINQLRVRQQIYLFKTDSLPSFSLEKFQMKMPNSSLQETNKFAGNRILLQERIKQWKEIVSLSVPYLFNRASSSHNLQLWIRLTCTGISISRLKRSLEQLIMYWSLIICLELLWYHVLLQLLSILKGLSERVNVPRYEEFSLLS